MGRSSIGLGNMLSNVSAREKFLSDPTRTLWSMGGPELGKGPAF